MRKQRGITLIALVITIIVLLILAGVSISMVIGNNGVLSQASTSVVETKEGEEKEQAELAYVSAKAVKLGGNVTAKDIDNELKANGVDATADGENPIIVKFTKTGNQYQIKDGKAVKSEGTTTSETLASKVTPANYGDKVEYSAGGVTDWKIFYNDGSNVFLIASDYLDNTKLPSETNMGTKESYPYSAYWPTTDNLTRAGATAINADVASKYKLSWLSTNSSSQNDNIKAVAALLDTNAWTSFVDTNYADSAIGSPTLEMLVESWNEKGYTKLYCNNSNSNGYYLGSESNPESGYVWATPKPSGVPDKYYVDTETYDDSLYWPHRTSYGYTYGYWLASPNGNGVKGLWSVNCEGGFYYTPHNNGEVSVRPVVSLKSEVLGTKSGDTWVLSK